MHAPRTGCTHFSMCRNGPSVVEPSKGGHTLDPVVNPSLLPHNTSIFGIFESIPFAASFAPVPLIFGIQIHGTMLVPRVLCLLSRLRCRRFRRKGYWRSERIAHRTSLTDTRVHSCNSSSLSNAIEAGMGFSVSSSAGNRGFLSMNPEPSRGEIVCVDEVVEMSNKMNMALVVIVLSSDSG